MNAVSGAAPAEVRFRLQNASFQHRISDSSPVEATPGMVSGSNRNQTSPAGLRAVHAAGLEYLVRHFLVEGEQHPDDDRQVHQRVDHDQAAAGVEQSGGAEQQIDWHQHADRRQHLGGQHPQQSAAGPLRRMERHGVSGRDCEQQRQDGAADRDDDAVQRERQIVGAREHLVVGRRASGENNSSGVIASRSDLKLVSTIQAIGKNSSSATSQPNDRGEQTLQRGCLHP